MTNQSPDRDRRNEWFVPGFGPLRFRLWVGLLFLPYTGMVLAFTVIGSMMAERIHWDRVAAIVVIYFLALGIGAASAVFSVVHGLLLQPLPVKEPDRLVRIWKNDVQRGFEHSPLFYPEYEHWEERATRFESMAALWSWGGRRGVDGRR